MPTCPKCHAETESIWVACPSCAQPLPKPAASRGSGIANTDSVMRAERDIVGGDKLEGDFRRIGTNVNGNINVNANNHLLPIVLAALFFAVVLGIVALVLVSRAPATPAPESQHVDSPVVPHANPPAAQPAKTADVQPVPAPVVQPIEPPVPKPLVESRIEVVPGTKDLKVTAYGLYTQSESDSRQAAEEKAYRKAHDEASKLVTGRLMTILQPEEHDSMQDLVATWGAGKLQVVNSRIESRDSALLATLEGELSMQDFEDYLGLKRKSKLSPGYSITPFEIDFGFHRQNGERIADGGTIRSGEQFWLEFTSSRDCYVYVINEGSSGNITPLYPRPDIDQDSSVREGRTVRLPSDDYDYRADQTSGREKVILIASLAPLSDIEYFARKFTQGKADRSDRALLAQAIQTRDIGIVARVETHGESIEIEKLQGKGALVRTVVFEHK